MLGFVGFFAVDAHGHGGGVALLWKNEGGITVINSCHNFIDFEVVHDQMGRWRYTGYYGYPERGRRVEAWNMLRKLSTESMLPWCIIGDFNDLMTADEKKGGDKFTWKRFRGTDKWVVERLDRGLANKALSELFTNVEVRVHEVSTSDHMSLCLQLHKQVYMARGKRFRFENMWIQEKECRNIVQDCWNSERENDLLCKLAMCCLRLEEWGGGLIKNLKSKMYNYRKEMQNLRSRMDINGVRKYNEARWNYLRLLEKQENFWRQRAKQYWLKDGDSSNTRFFHKFASVRKEHNKIRKLKDVNGVWQDTEKGIQNLIIQYFENIFTANEIEEQMSKRINFKRIMEEQSHDLMQGITYEEVRAAVFAMYPEKSPGIDGLNPFFFQTYWNVVSKDVIAFCGQYFDHGELPDEINRTLVCLIPKVKQPKQVSDLRPISLCNVLMRIISKVMANRLKPCLSLIISNNQSAFIEGRLLTDNALLAFEINHHIHRKTQGADGVAGLKIDVSKAYDRLEWKYIELMLNKFGFPHIWICRVMQLVRTVAYSFLRHGKTFGDVRLYRGIRQGDLISIYLYIICVEGLTGILDKYEESGLINGCRVARGAPRITHLLFANDCYLFFKAKHTEAQHMQNILQKYERLSGQMINNGKSDIVFSPNTREAERVQICGILGVNEKARPGKYLGMPMYVGGSKKEAFGFITDKIQGKLQAWSNKDLSKVGKLTLVKTSAQTTSNFWMSLFQIPDLICDEIERKMNAFLWGGGPNGRGVKWITWKRLCVPKEFGGLGLKELKNFNMAMLAKQGWRLLTEANPLVSTVMKAKYYSESNLLNAELGHNPSYVWRGIFTSLEAVRVGARRRIGDGDDTMVWRVPWLPDERNGYVCTSENEHLASAKISNLMMIGERKWDIELIDDLFDARDSGLIKCIPLSTIVNDDSWYWVLDEKSEFTVRSCYRRLQGECRDDQSKLWKRIWAMKLPSKVTNLVWRACKGCLPTNAALVLKHVNIEVECPWCHCEAETDVHVMFLCDFTKTVWQTAGMTQLVNCSSYETPSAVFERVFEQGTKEQCVEIVMLCWNWKEAHVKEEGRKFRGEVGDRIWSPPAAGWLKINIDVVVFLDETIGVGAVARNDRGCFIGARCVKIAGAWKPREAEAIGLKEALSWVIAQGYTNCVFETDSYVLADACNGSPGRALFGTIVMDCVHMFKHINSVLVKFTYRYANNVAHMLAQATYSMTDIGKWYVTSPNFFIRVLELDLID